MGLGYGKVVDTVCVLCWIRDRFTVEVDANDRACMVSFQWLKKQTYYDQGWSKALSNGPNDSENCSWTVDFKIHCPDWPVKIFAC